MNNHNHDPDDLSARVLFAGPRLSRDERERLADIAKGIREDLALGRIKLGPIMPLPSPARTIRVTKHTLRTLQPIEPGGEVCVKNETDQEVYVDTGVASRGMFNRIAELEQERDALKARVAELEAVCLKVLDTFGGDELPRELSPEDSERFEVILAVTEAITKEDSPDA